MKWIIQSGILPLVLKSLCFIALATVVVMMECSIFLEVHLKIPNSVCETIKSFLLDIEMFVALFHSLL